MSEGFYLLALVLVPISAIIFGCWLGDRNDRKEIESEKEYLLLKLLEMDSDLYYQTITRLEKSNLTLRYQIEYIKEVINKNNRGRYYGS